MLFPRLLSPRLARPWLSVDLGGPCRVLSWAPARPGLVEARRVVWREVRDADLTEDLDAEAWLAAELRARGLGDAVGLLTSRRLDAWTRAAAEAEGAAAECLATVGLGNAERAGAPRRAPRRPEGGAGAAAPAIGTINLLLRLSAPLSEAGLLEAMSIAAAARTAAVMAHGPRLPSGPATGTGTDCIAVAAPPGTGRHAGLHTPLGEAAGLAVHDAVARGARAWMAERG